ncbi:RNA-binding protein [Paenibacillus thermotolerans]|uniref:YlmH family RNA-binding protein n=1 Tax=Paenibacillus thermotolerans TaxID=3027807 RepID=UPI002368DF50|nr:MULTISPECIES: YlmH/Sll1252 family protein [unclassified Paenibacillus]
MKQPIYEHFHPDEKPLVDKAAEWVLDAGKYHQIRRTDFLDPRQAFILTALANRDDYVRLRLDGGWEGAERVRAVITPEYADPQVEPIGIGVLELRSDDPKVADLEHGDYLGAILGLGVKRDKIGDIHVHDWGCHILIAEEMASFFSLHMNQAGRIRVSADIVPLERLQTAAQQMEEMFCTVASMRLDGIVSEATRLSRAKVIAPIQNGRCKVNWKVEENPSAQLKEGDVISVQGFGRFKLLAVEGLSKKGRIRLKIGKFA